MLVTQRDQSLDLDPVAVTAGRALHTDQLGEGSDQNREILVDVQANGVRSKLLVRETIRRGLADAVEPAVVRREQEVRPPEDGALIDRRSNI